MGIGRVTRRQIRVKDKANANIHRDHKQHKHFERVEVQTGTVITEFRLYSTDEYSRLIRSLFRTKLSNEQRYAQSLPCRDLHLPCVL